MGSTAAALFVLLSTFLTATAAMDDFFQTRRCEPIRIQMCTDIGYNLTSMPNGMNHQTQEEAGLEAHQFRPLVEVNCSALLKFFLCSMYFPICLKDYDKALPPCREVCQHARSGCEPLMTKYDFIWPEHLSCESLPEQVPDRPVCMGPPPKQRQRPQGNPPPPDVVLSEGRQCACSCRPPFVSTKGRGWGGNWEVGNVSDCAYPCRSPYLSEDESRQHMMTWWLGTFGILCTLVTTITVASFLIDMDRFNYPERPIFFISFCYLMVSIGYLIRLGLGHQAVACDGDIARVGNSHPASCVVVFLLTYVFGMASSVWWVVLSFTWFLAAGLKWSNEAIATYSPYFHTTAWLIPSAKTITILALNGVEGDPMSGICYVGATNTNHLRLFVLGPLCAYLVLGLCFLFAGLVSLCRIQSLLKASQGASKTEKLTKLMYKIGIFTLLYSLPATSVIVCLFIEQHYRERWEVGSLCPCSGGGGLGREGFQLALVKYSMGLVVGITTGLWVWHRKTLASWHSFAQRRLCCLSQYQRAPAYEPAEAMIIKSHTDISSQGPYSSRHGYPLNHV